MSGAEGPQRRPIGRPRRLTLRQIVDVGLEIGLEDLSISEVALRLGVSLGTLYSYVENLDELKRLVAADLMERPVLREEGQHWAEVMRGHAVRQFEILARDPKLTAQVVQGAVSIEDAMIDVETVLALLTARGFTIDEAYDVYQAVTHLVSGAALSAVISRARAQRGQPRSLMVAEAFERLPDTALPNLRAVGSRYSEEAGFHAFHPALERMLEDVARRRGEPAPPA